MAHGAAHLWPNRVPSVSVSVSVAVAVAAPAGPSAMVRPCVRLRSVRGAPILRPRPWLRPGPVRAAVAPAVAPWRKAMRLRPAVALARNAAKKKAGPVREPAFDGGQLLSAAAFFVLSVYFMRETLVSVPIR
jgi:hypothetical protein